MVAEGAADVCVLVVEEDGGGDPEEGREGHEEGQGLGGEQEGLWLEWGNQSMIVFCKNA